MLVVARSAGSGARPAAFVTTAALTPRDT